MANIRAGGLRLAGFQSLVLDVDAIEKVCDGFGRALPNLGQPEKMRTGDVTWKATYFLAFLASCQCVSVIADHKKSRRTSRAVRASMTPGLRMAMICSTR